MGRFSRLVSSSVTPVTQGWVDSYTEKNNDFNTVAPVTPVTPQKWNHDNKADERDVKRTSNLARELPLPSVTGVTSVTALKNNDNSGYTSVSKDVTGVTGGRIGKSFSPPIVVAIRTGDPMLIAAAVAADPELIERAAIREFDANMSRLDAEIATLLDAIDEAGYVL